MFRLFLVMGNMEICYMYRFSVSSGYEYIKIEHGSNYYNSFQHLLIRNNIIYTYYFFEY